MIQTPAPDAQQRRAIRQRLVVMFGNRQQKLGQALVVEHIEDESNHDQCEEHGRNVNNAAQTPPALAMGIEENLSVGHPLLLPHVSLNSPGLTNVQRGCYFHLIL